MMPGLPEEHRGTFLSAEEWNSRGNGFLPGLLGIEVVAIESGMSRLRLAIRPELMAPNGFIHAGTVTTLADTSCGYGCMASLPEGANGFTTIELKCNFMGTVQGGAILSEATLHHAGRMTQVWDARVYAEGEERTLALFRCTQMILYPRNNAVNVSGT